MDKIDKKLLYYIDQEPLTNNRDLAQLCSIDEKDVLDRVRDLFDSGVIKYTMPIINLDRLGFSVYIFEIECETIFSDSNIDSIIAKKNIAWLASSVDKKILLGAIFARTPIECASVIATLKESLMDLKGVRFDCSQVVEKYVLGQRYLLVSERRTDIRFDNSRVAYDGDRTRALESSEANVLESVRELQEVSLGRSSRSIGMSVAEVASTLMKLRKDQVIVKFQPVFDAEKLGVRWFHVSVKARTFDPEYSRYIDFLHEITNCVHINLTLGEWDLNYEIHCENEGIFESILKQIDDKYSFLIERQTAIEIGKEHKFNFLVDIVLDAARGTG